MGLIRGKTAHLACLPVEILLEIYQFLDVGAIFDLSATNRFFFSFYQQRKACILLPVLEREFSPFEELLQVYTASIDDIGAKDGLYTPRRVVFKRSPGDTGLVLAPQRHSQVPVRGHENGFVQVNKDGRTVASATPGISTVVLAVKDLDGLLKKCQLVRKWEELFPQMRWIQQPENCRFLRPHESVRLRGALYKWWLYGIYFHGEFPRPRVGHPEPHVQDIRISQMRHHSTAELLELMDFVEVVKDVILHYICPRLDPREHGHDEAPPLVETTLRSQSLATGWGDQSRWGRVVKTYAKLGPEQLMYYFDNIYSYSRKRLITEVRLQHPSFAFDQESVQVAVRCALDERNWLDSKPSLAEDGCGGIIDFDDERDDERLALKHDGSPDGSLPRGATFIRSYSRYSPRGDDGSSMEDWPRWSSLGGAHAAAAAALDAVVW